MITDLTAPQSEFHESKAAYVAAVAGFGSGKTRAAVSRIITNKLKYPAVDTAYLAPTYGLIRDIFYPYMTEYLHSMGASFTINKSEHNIYIHGYGQIYCRTMDNPDMIVGWECGDAYMDEFDILPTDKALKVMNKVAARCRQKFPDGKKNQKLITTTPEGFKATYELFKKNPLADSHLIQMATSSNTNLPDGYIEDLKSQYPPQLIEAYLEGKFVNLTSGTVFNAYNRVLNSSRETIRKGELLRIGMDFNVTNMSAVTYVLRPKMDENNESTGVVEWHAVDEFVEVYDTPSMIDMIKEQYSEHNIRVYPDATGKARKSTNASISDISLLEDAGFAVYAEESNPFVKDRVNAANRAFNDRKLFVNEERCPELANCFEQLVYDKNGEPDKKSNNDHLPDAATYPVAFEMPIVRPAYELELGFVH